MVRSRGAVAEREEEPLGEEEGAGVRGEGRPRRTMAVVDQPDREAGPDEEEEEEDIGETIATRLGGGVG